MNQLMGELVTTGHQKIILSPYTVFENHVVYKCAAGRYWFPRGMAKQIVYMTDYLKDLRLVCPVQHVKRVPQNRVSAALYPKLGSIKIVPLQSSRFFLRRLDNVGHNFTQIRRALEAAEVVETNASGLMKIATVLLLLRGAAGRPKWILGIDGSIVRGGRRIGGRLERFLLERSLRAADLILPTQEKIRDRLVPRSRKDNTFIVPVSWVEQEACLDDWLANDMWQRKCADRELRLVYAGRLEPDNGLMVLLKSLDILQQKGIALKIEIVGAGQMEPHVSAAMRKYQGPVKVVQVPPFKNSALYLASLRKAHAVIVPFLGNQQPRVVFDAFSQAVPVISSDTNGLRKIVNPHKTGFVFQRGNEVALAELLAIVSTDISVLKNMGLEGLNFARTRTHYEVHSRRSEIVSSLIN